MSTSLEVLTEYLRNLPFDTSINVIELEYEIQSLQRSLDSLIEQREYFCEFWKDYRTKDFSIDEPNREEEPTEDQLSCECHGIASGLAIQKIIIKKYNEKIRKLESELDIEKEKLDKYNKINEKKERLEMAISEVENLLKPPKMYKKLMKKVTRKQESKEDIKQESKADIKQEFKADPKLCSHSIITSDSYSTYCEDCGKVLYTTP